MLGTLFHGARSGHEQVQEKGVSECSGSGEAAIQVIRFATVRQQSISQPLDLGPGCDRVFIPNHARLRVIPDRLHPIGTWCIFIRIQRGKGHRRLTSEDRRYRGFLWKSINRGMNMEKQLGNAAYWIGILSTVIALITRLLAAAGVFVFPAASGKIPISYRSFLDGAILFFLMAIASSVAMWAKSQKS